MRHQVKKIKDNIFLLYGVPDECCIYLVCGSEAALVVDTGFGITDLKEDIEKLTDLPYWVVNTHGHGDHSGGNIYFDTVYMSAAAEPDAADAINLNRTKLSAETMDLIEERLKSAKYRPSFIDEGFEFDLGDRQVEVLEIPGHTSGCLAFLDKQDRAAFTGDCCVKSMDILMVVPQALTLSEYCKSMKKLASRSADFDEILTGHDEEPMPASFVEDVVYCCEKILSGEWEGEDLELPPVFENTKAKRIAYKDFAIDYRQEKLV